ncbi:hypothetical protein ACP70R_010945 [Stipagrostis hirtigluma subsp. patula]
MDRARNERELRRRADFVDVGLAAVLAAASFLLVLGTAGGGDAGAGGTGVAPGTEWQAVLAFGLMSAGLLCVMHGMRARDARPPGLVRRAADAAAAALWHAGGPERLLPLLLLILCPFLEEWFDFF